jgi:asparagine synthase (glutamine-hydrolysing)
LETSLHLFQPPRYRATDGTWHRTWQDTLAHSGPELTLDPASVFSLVSFHLVCGDRTHFREIRRLPWLSEVGRDGDARLESIPPHDLRWLSYPQIADELLRRLGEEMLRACQGRREVYVLLSGGLDSRIVAGVLARLVREGRLDARPTAMTWGLADSRDTVYGREAARILGLEWRHVELGPQHLLENVEDTARLLGALVSPIHLHRMTWFRSVSRDALVLAGNYGDMVGRAEFSGTRLLELSLLEASNPFGLVRREVLESARQGVGEELRALHARSPRGPRYVLCEHEMHGHYTRCLIAHAMSVIDHFCDVYQMFTDPSVYGFMWSLHPSLRFDEVYAELLERLHPELARLPWARTNRALRGRTEGARADLRRHFHDYPGWVSGALRDALDQAVDPDWCAATGLFDGGRVRTLRDLARVVPDREALHFAGNPFEVYVWLASFRRLVEWAESLGKHVRFAPAAESPAPGDTVATHGVGRLRRLLRSSPVIHDAVRSARRRWLRTEARLRYPPRR